AIASNPAKIWQGRRVLWPLQLHPVQSTPGFRRARRGSNHYECLPVRDRETISRSTEPRIRALLLQTRSPPGLRAGQPTTFVSLPPPKIPRALEAFPMTAAGV